MSKLIECPNCHKLNPNRLSHRHLENDIIELGFLCQHCRRWAHMGYWNEVLLERQKHLTNRRRIRAFNRDYALLQKEVENEPT